MVLLRILYKEVQLIFSPVVLTVSRKDLHIK